MNSKGILALFCLIIFYTPCGMAANNDPEKDSKERTRLYGQDIDALNEAVRLFRVGSYDNARGELDVVRSHTLKSVVEGTSILATKSFKDEKERKLFLAALRVSLKKRPKSPKLPARAQTPQPKLPSPRVLRFVQSAP